MRGKGPTGQYTKQPALQGLRKEKGQGGLGRRARRGSGKEQEAGRGRGREAVVRRYHGRLQGRGILGWAYETVFVVALWLRQENRWFSSSRVTKAAQVRLPDLPCPLAWPGLEELGLRWPPLHYANGSNGWRDDWRRGVFGGVQKPSSGGILKVGPAQRLVLKHLSRNLCLCQMPHHCIIIFHPKKFRIFFSLYKGKER